MSESATTQHAPERRDRTHYLYIAVIVAVVLGIAVGILVARSVGKALKPLGTGFVNLIKMMISPVIFCTIVLGVGSIRQAAKVGKVGGLALALLHRHVDVRPDHRADRRQHAPAGCGPAASPTPAGPRAAAAGARPTTTEFLLGIIPTTLVSPLVGESCCRPCSWRCSSGSRCRRLGQSGQAILRGVKHFERLVFRVLAMIMWVAPIGAFGAIAAVVGETGWSALVALGQIMLAFYITCAIFIVGRARR